MLILAPLFRELINRKSGVINMFSKNLKRTFQEKLPTFQGKSSAMCQQIFQEVQGLLRHYRSTHQLFCEMKYGD
jgi:hypothetical protein